MKVYLVWHVDYIDAYESVDDVIAIFDSKERAAEYILNKANCKGVSVSELVKAEQLILDSNGHFYTNIDEAPMYNLEFYNIDEYEMNCERGR